MVIGDSQTRGTFCNRVHEKVNNKQCNFQNQCDMCSACKRYVGWYSHGSHFRVTALMNIGLRCQTYQAVSSSIKIEYDTLLL